jgi:hypothetical protein
MHKILTLTLLTLASSPYCYAAGIEGTYGLHLFFDEKDNVDVLTLSRDEHGALTGKMHVPNDFDGPVLNVEEKDGTLSFDLPVPKNSHRPHDLMFRYEGRIFDHTKRQLAGFVTLKGEREFVASFVAFKRAEDKKGK